MLQISFKACSPKYGPLVKARDFSTVVNFNRFSNGTFIILNRPAYHQSTPPTKKFVRATILLAANVIEPIGSDRKKCLVTQIAHVNPGGITDTPAMAWIINSLCAVGPPTFLRKLETAAQIKSDKKAKLGMPDFGNVRLSLDKLAQGIKQKALGLKLPCVNIPFQTNSILKITGKL